MPDLRSRGVTASYLHQHRPTSTSMSLYNKNPVFMGVLSRYWKMFRIHPASDTAGYQTDGITLAQEFLEQQLIKSEHSPSGKEPFETLLLSYFKAQNSQIDLETRALAGLCLRCAVSEPILRACQRIERLFAGGTSFSYRDLLPFVLTDDGQSLIVFDSDEKTQLILQEDGSLCLNNYPFFSVEILQTFRADSGNNMSLKNWVYFKTKQHPELKNFLSDYGFQKISDWALLNRTRSAQLEQLSTRDRLLVEVFHGVYRRDRRQQAKGAKKCPDPGSKQLQEMISKLQESEVIISSEAQLLKDLKQVAKQLRKYEVWSNRQPLEVYNSEKEQYEIRSDIRQEYEPQVEIEQQELLEFLHQQLRAILTEAIRQEVQQKIQKLKKSRKYAEKASEFIPGLRLYYVEGMSLKDIAPVLEMSSWDQARRILNPGELLSKIRTITVENLLEKVLNKAHKMGLTSLPPKADYLNLLIQAVEAFADQEVFRAATEEMRTGKNRSFKSIYAQYLRAYLSQII
ncbi:hypothetical protein ACL6C3_06070 [Capilliphycus salinus ALCB114379]|uniref:hypothetical protein n=1 Tax=Capilliphycus salinus TaxID=2768948 RepID=UPI0039A4E383